MGFEAAVEALISGDAATLELLLRDDPELVRDRSARAHRATHGARLDVEDTVHHGTPLGWAIYGGQEAIAICLKNQAGK